MKNLFIMHTQYNLILSAAVLSRIPKAENTLVLYSEFSLNDEVLTAIKKVFDWVFVVRDQFYAPTSGLEDIKEIHRCLRKVKALRKKTFDCVYMSQERTFDMILWARAKKNNPNARCYNIEEDAYYSINEQYNQEDFEYTESKRIKRYKFLRAMLLLGYPYDYRDVHYCYGMSRAYNGAMLLYPNLARRELQGKKLEEIQKQELLIGIESIYSEIRTTYPPSEKYTVFFFDLMNRYRNPVLIKAIIGDILSISERQGRTVLFKYHPRETEKLTDLTGAYEIPHWIPAEKVLFDLKDKDIVVLGNATTSCIVAAKLGFKVISTCRIESPGNLKMHNTMKKMNILCIEDAVDIENFVK